MSREPILPDSTAWAILGGACIIGPGCIASAILCLAKLGWGF